MINDKAKLWAAGSVAICVIAAVLWWMSLGYSKVSDKGYQYAMAMISICNQKDVARLEKIREQITASTEDEELPSYDSRVLIDIADRAAAGDWDSATGAIRRLMKDQVDTR